MSRYHWLLIGFVVIGLAFGLGTNPEINIVKLDSTPIASKERPISSPQDVSTNSPVLNKSNSTAKASTDSTAFISPIDRLAARTQKTELHHSIIAEHKKFKRYPPENHRFETPEQDPVAQRYAVDERSTINEDHTFGLTIWSEQKFYLQGDLVNVFAFVQNKEGQKIPAQYEALLIFNNQRLTPVEFKDEDQDGSYQGVIDLSTVQTPGIYKVLITAPQQNITDAITFTLSQPDIALTGNMKDSINEQGHLTIEVEVDVQATHPFYFQASLYSVTGVPVGVTQASHTLNAGKHWIPLTYSGLMIRDANESGPYVLQQVSLAKVTMPMQRAPALNPDYQTEAYGLDEFSDQVYAEN